MTKSLVILAVIFQWMSAYHPLDLMSAYNKVGMDLLFKISMLGFWSFIHQLTLEEFIYPPRRCFFCTILYIRTLYSFTKKHPGKISVRYFASYHKCSFGHVCWKYMLVLRWWITESELKIWMEVIICSGVDIVILFELEG